MNTESRKTRSEKAAMTAFATKRHSEHVGYRDDFCKKCKTESLHEWAKKEGLM